MIYLMKQNISHQLFMACSLIYKFQLNKILFMGNSVQKQKVQKIEQRNREIAVQVRALKQYQEELNIKDNLIQQVINATAFQLVQMLNQNKVTSKQLTVIFCYRSATIGMNLVLVTEHNFIQALRVAEQCDQVRKSTGKRNWKFGDKWDMEQFLPPLYGIPISIKQCINMDGFASTMGVVNTINTIQEDGAILHVTRNSGMIPFVRTNIPQLGMSFECSNNLWGRSLNPWNTLRSPGGSSGGQAGLIASKCSPIGIGSDLAGSLRIPSAFCGLYTLKPTSRRISMDGHRMFHLAFTGNGNFATVMGPIAKSVQDVALWMKIATTQQLYGGKSSLYTHYKSFDEQIYMNAFQNKKMRIGFFPGFKMIEPSRAGLRALEETIEILKKIGHQVVEIEIPNEKQLISQFFQEVCAEGGLKSYKQILKGQKFISQYANFQFIQNRGKWAYAFLNKIMNLVMPRVGFIMESCKKKESVNQYLKHGGRIHQLKRDWMKHLRTQNLDLIIAPAMPLQACKHDISQHTTFSACYSFVFTLLDMPTGVQPITVVQENEQDYDSKFNDMITMKLKENAKGSQGLPVAIQVIGMPYEQEKILGFMKQIQKQVRFSEKHPLPNLRAD